MVSICQHTTYCMKMVICWMVYFCFTLSNCKHSDSQQFPFIFFFFGGGAGDDSGYSYFHAWRLKVKRLAGELGTNQQCFGFLLLFSELLAKYGVMWYQRFWNLCPFTSYCDLFKLHVACELYIRMSPSKRAGTNPN